MLWAQTKDKEELRQKKTKHRRKGPLPPTPRNAGVRTTLFDKRVTLWRSDGSAPDRLKANGRSFSVGSTTLRRTWLSSTNCPRLRAKIEGSSTLPNAEQTAMIHSRTLPYGELSGITNGLENSSGAMRQLLWSAAHPLEQMPDHCDARLQSQCTPRRSNARHRTQAGGRGAHRQSSKPPTAVEAAFAMQQHMVPTKLQSDARPRGQCTPQSAGEEPLRAAGSK